MQLISNKNNSSFLFFVPDFEDIWFDNDNDYEKHFFSKNNVQCYKDLGCYN